MLVGCVVVALVAIATPAGSVGAEPSIEPILEIERVEGTPPYFKDGGYLILMCSDATLSQVDVVVDGEPFLVFDDPVVVEEPCGPGAALYGLGIGESILSLFPGVHTIDLTLTYADGSTSEVSRDLYFAGSGARGAIDSVTVTGNSVRVVGWALDLDRSFPVQAQVSGTAYGGRPPVSRNAVALKERPDVERAFPGYGPYHGFDVTLPLTDMACLSLVPMGGGGPLFTCKRAVSKPVRGRVEFRDAVQRSILVSGWTADPDGPAKALVTFNGFPVVVEPTRKRAGVSSPYNTEWAAWYSMAPGSYNVCVSHLDVPFGTPTGTSCEQVVVK